MNRKLILIFVLLLLAGAALLLTLGLVRKTVAIVIDEQVSTTTAWALTVQDVLRAEGIPLYQGDEVTPGLDQPVQENQIIQVQRAGWVVLVKGASQVPLWTAERHPRTLFQNAGIPLQPGDRLYTNGELVDLAVNLPYQPVRVIEVEPSTFVAVDDGGEIRTFQATASTLADALWEKSFVLYAADRLSPDPLTILAGNAITATITRSQAITITLADATFHTRVQAGTVGEALSKAGLPLQGMDYSIPTDSLPLPQDGNIRVVQVREETLVEQETIPFGVEYIASPEIDIDTQQVIRTGQYGILAKRIRVVYEDGQEVSRTVSDTWEAKPPQPRQVGYGTKITVKSLSTSDGTIQYYRAVQAFATSYSPCRIGVAGQCSNRTASGAELKKGVIGVIRSWYNDMKGAMVYIPGYGFGTIEDIGSGFSDRHWVDLGYSDADWVRWSGYVTVYFLTPVPGNILYILN